jgi:hypothetical protein
MAVRSRSFRSFFGLDGCWRTRHGLMDANPGSRQSARSDQSSIPQSVTRSGPRLGQLMRRTARSPTGHRPPAKLIGQGPSLLRSVSFLSGTRADLWHSTPGAQILERSSVENVFLFDPSTPRLIDAVIEQLEIPSRMSVARYDNLDTGLFDGEAGGVG